MNDRYFSEMKRCKIDWLDDIFYGTKESKGTRNAVGAMKLVLLDDYSVVPEGLDIKDKYEFISSKFNGRAKAKMLQDIDIIQILCNYVLASFGLRNTKFNISYSDYEYYRTHKIVNKGYSKDYIIELVAFALCDSIYSGYILVASNKFMKEELLEALIEERYIEGKDKELSEFDGALTNDEIDYDTKVKYYTAFKNLDDSFLKIKRRDSEYVSYKKENK